MLCAIAAIALTILSQEAPKTVTISSLLDEMTGIDRLACLPSPAYKQLQASSYDRAQTDPKNKETWFANGDWGGFIRNEVHNGKQEWVLMEHEGPGAVTRFWIPLSPDKDNAILRFRFDGAEKPAIEVKYQDLLRGRGMFKPPFAFIAWPDASLSSSVGGDLFFPIPFAKGCKITSSEAPYYFAVNYRAYESGTKVKTFTVPDFAALEGKVALTGRLLLAKSLDRGLESKGTNHPRITGEAHRSEKATLSRGKSIKLKLAQGPRAVQRVVVQVPKGVTAQQLRSTVIEMTFDGKPTVWCPIGDFFGCGVRFNPVWDRYRRVEADGTLTCYWPMPYRKSASLRLVNLCSEPIRISVQVDTKPWSWDDRTMVFHTTWRHEYPIETRPFHDWNYVDIEGRGVYVGDTLTVMNPSRSWYGEGDEKIYIDGESFPSHLGTGTEDYYSYAWGMAERFTSPFIAMPKRDHATRDDWSGYTTTSRVRLLDGITFDKSLKFDMEIWHAAQCKEEYSAACFWYALPGAKSNRAPSPDEAANPIPELRANIKGAIECETMQVIGKSDGVVIETQTNCLSEGSWSGDQQLYVKNDKLGGFVELRVPVKKPGKYLLVLHATKSWDYGTFRFSVNGRNAKDVDLWNATAIASGPIDLGVFSLSGGSAVLRVEAIGANPKSTGQKYFFGLDCLVAKPMK